VDDDFNFPAGLAVLFELAKEIYRERNLPVHRGKWTPSPMLERQWHTLVCPAQVLGFEVHPETSVSFGGLSDAEIEAMIQERQAARKLRNFAKQTLATNPKPGKALPLIDSPDGVTRWHCN